MIKSEGVVKSFDTILKHINRLFWFLGLGKRLNT